MGSPQPPTAAQVAQLEAAGGLATIEPTRRLQVRDGRVQLAFTLPRQGVSLLRFTW